MLLLLLYQFSKRIALCIVINTELSIISCCLNFQTPAEIIRVGFNMTSVSVEEGSGIVTLCVVILSGEHFREFNISVYTVTGTAGLCIYISHMRCVILQVILLTIYLLIWVKYTQNALLV